MADVLTVDPPRDLSRIPDILRRTVPWVRLMSIMLFLSSGLMILGGVAVAIAMTAGLAVSGSGPSRFQAAPALFGGAMYACMGLINLFPGVFLWKFASRAKAYVVGPTLGLLEQALDAQRSYWKFMGIFILIAMVLMVVVIGIAGVAGFMFARAAAGR